MGCIKLTSCALTLSVDNVNTKSIETLSLRGLALIVLALEDLTVCVDLLISTPCTLYCCSCLSRVIFSV